VSFLGTLVKLWPLAKLLKTVKFSTEAKVVLRVAGRGRYYWLEDVAGERLK
jgi:hypothetical protein